MVENVAFAKALLNLEELQSDARTNLDEAHRALLLAAVIAADIVLRQGHLRVARLHLGLGPGAIPVVCERHYTKDDKAYCSKSSLMSVKL